MQVKGKHLQYLSEEDEFESSLRPKRLSEFVGQEKARANLSVFIDAAKARGEALDHVLFSGPPGLGKTTLAQIVARELGAGFRSTSGPVLARAGDLAALLTNLEPRDVLFIDEIHRLNPVVEEILYPAMEDFQLDLIIGEGPAARSVRIDLAPFTLVAATTRTGLLATEHAVLDDTGKLAAVFALGTSGGEATSADPKVRALQVERRALEQQVESLKVLKGSMDPAKYEAELERLVTALALKTRELRQAEAGK